MRPSSVVRKGGPRAGWWASLADLRFPGRQRGLSEGGEPARGGEADAGVWGRLFVPFRAGPVGSEDEPEPRQSGQASPGSGFGPPLATRGAGVGGAGAARGGEAPQLPNARPGPRAGRRRAPRSGPNGGIADLARSSGQGRCRSRGPPRTPRAGGRCPGRWRRGRAGRARRVGAGLGSHRTLGGVRCGLFPAPLRKLGLALELITGKRGVHEASPLLPRAGREGGRMRRRRGSLSQESGPFKRASLFLVPRHPAPPP